jgi:hypothetical protein
VADGNYGAGVVAYRCRYYFYALDVQIVGGFVQNEHIREFLKDTGIEREILLE